MKQNITGSQSYQNIDTSQPNNLSEFILMEADVRYATNLPKMDILGKVDAYAKFLPIDVLSPPNSLVNSRVVEKDYNPKWNQTLVSALRVSSPISIWSQPTLQLFDWDKVTSDSSIGQSQAELSIRQLIHKCAQQAFLKRRSVSDTSSLSASSEEAFGHFWKSTEYWLEGLCNFHPVIYTMTKKPQPCGAARLNATVSMKIPSHLLDPSAFENNSVATELRSALDQLCQEEITQEKERKNAVVPKLLDWDFEEDRVRDLTQRRIDLWIQQVESYLQHDLPDRLQKLYAGSPEENKRKVLAVVADPGVDDESDEQYKLVSEKWQRHLVDKESQTENDNTNGLQTISAVFFSLPEALEWRKERLSSYDKNNTENEHVVLLLAAYPETHRSRNDFDTTSRIHFGRISDLISSSTTLVGYRRFILFDEECDLYQQLVDRECSPSDLSRKFPWPKPPYADIPHPPTDVSCDRVMKLTVQLTGQELYRDTEMYVPEGSEGVYLYHLSIPRGAPASNEMAWPNLNKGRRDPYVFQINVMPRTRVTIADCNFHNTLIGIAFAASFTMRDTRIYLYDKYVSPVRIGPLAESYAIEGLPLDHDRCIRKWLAKKDEVARMEQLMQDQPMYVSLVNCSLNDQLSQSPHSAVHLSRRIRLLRSSHIRDCSLTGYRQISGEGLTHPIVVNDLQSDSDEDNLLTGADWFGSEQCTGNSNIYEKDADWNEFNKGEEAQTRLMKRKMYE
eukprot:gb/GECH01001482.1/.p1 GENE.gb/GECH01001482.1/~~gb/GECH01001482.1/.p1  ORF type:complete len:732 (+),score=102.17 gb/GECH01001482.1/:1-2196(+)